MFVNSIFNGDNRVYILTEDTLKEFGESLIAKAKAEIEAKADNAYFTPEEVCKLFGVVRSTLYRWEGRGYLVPIRIGVKVRYKKSDVHKLIEK